MTVSKELNQVLTCSSERSLTSLQIVLEAIVVTGNLENYKMSSSEEEDVAYRYVIIVFDTYWNFYKFRMLLKKFMKGP